jgi:hypothetical protein
MAGGNRIYVRSEFYYWSLNSPVEYCYYCTDAHTGSAHPNGKHIKTENQVVVMTEDGTLEPFCSSLLETPDLVTSNRDTEELTIAEAAIDIKLQEMVDSTYCGSSRWDYTCKLYEWPDCDTEIDTNHLYVKSDQNVIMNRDNDDGFTYDVCYKCTGNGMTIKTPSAWSVTLTSICQDSISTDHSGNMDVT